MLQQRYAQLTPRPSHSGWHGLLATRVLEDLPPREPPAAARTTRPRHAFSLVELLVVIAIVAVLIAILFPAIRLAWRQAQATQCASQLRQLGAALHAYAADNRGWLPAWSGWHTWPPGLAGAEYGPAWTVELIPYIGPPDSAIYNCPSSPVHGRRRNYFLAAQWAGRSGRNAMKLTDITMSSRFVLSADKTKRSLYSTDPRLDDADPDDYSPNHDPTPALAWPSHGAPHTHPHGNNVLFDDLHVTRHPRHDPNRMTYNPRRMEDWNAVTPD